MFDNDAVDYFRGITERIVKDRGEDGSKQKDFVQLCLDKLIDDPKPGHPDTKIDKYGQPWSPKGMVLDEIFLLMFSNNLKYLTHFVIYPTG